MLNIPLLDKLCSFFIHVEHRLNKDSELSDKIPADQISAPLESTELLFSAPLPSACVSSQLPKGPKQRKLLFTII